MADADAKPPSESDPDASPIASISPSSGGGNAAAVENQFADLAVADELPKPSGWEDGTVLGVVGGDEVSGEKLPVAAGADSRPRFPRRPGEPDCTYYVKFGSCRFGMKCKFNHPARKKRNRVKASGSSGSNSSSNKASSPDDEQMLFQKMGEEPPLEMLRRETSAQSHEGTRTGTGSSHVGSALDDNAIDGNDADINGDNNHDTNNIDHDGCN